MPSPQALPHHILKYLLAKQLRGLPLCLTLEARLLLLWDRKIKTRDRKGEEAGAPVRPLGPRGQRPRQPQSSPVTQVPRSQRVMCRVESSQAKLALRPTHGRVSSSPFSGAMWVRGPGFLADPTPQTHYLPSWKDFTLTAEGRGSYPGPLNPPGPTGSATP